MRPKRSPRPWRVQHASSTASTPATRDRLDCKNNATTTEAALYRAKQDATSRKEAA